MTGLRRAARRWGAALLIAAVTTVAAAAELTLPALLTLLGSVPSGQADFTEERTVAALDTTLHSSGRLAFSAPDHFERVTLQPRGESLTVDGNTVTLRRGEHVRTLQLDTVPEAEAVVAALRGTLTGDVAVLNRLFVPTVRGATAAWRLTLVPKDAALRRTVASIELQGAGRGLQAVELQLGNGDHSLMRIAPLVASAPRAR